ncbi:MULTISPECIES: MFS transporter [unclassified Pseudofrankia]|uniref:MFS transporter n=1 Tax=unclassified Pseudofrankia TaxID=2994372 RepID=UPI0008DA9214|nr:MULTISPECIES: MFS transporter [unclassified Pseudofrankia]MDT3440508.1 MFS transporter [Pseudofrankia sp. BMG5.37]OHV47526.1 MFS transporter [Pseudofrankia sp. BMG5.36]
MASNRVDEPATETPAGAPSSPLSSPTTTGGPPVAVPAPAGSSRPAPATRPARPAEPAEPDPRRWRVLPAVLVATFMSLFDIFVVNVAAPSIGADLRASDAGLELIVAGYSFTYAAGLITGGRLGDSSGRRRMFLIGMALFTVASALCGVAPSEATLIAGRLAQGLGAAAMVPQALAIINVIFPPAERARAFAYFGVTVGLGAVSGQVIGGLLVDLDIFGLGWRPIFLVNVPIGIVAMAVVWRLLAESKAARPEPLDLVGLTALAAGLGLVLVPLTLGRDEGWPVWTWLALAAGVVVLAAFGRWEARLARTGGHPIVPPAVLRTRRTIAGLLVSFGFFTFFGSFLLAATIFLQDGQHRSPLNAGLVFGPLGVAFALSSMAARGLVARYGPRTLTVGAAISFTGLAVLLAMVATEGVGVPTGELMPPLLAIGVGNGLIVPALVAAVLAGAPADVSGAVSGLLTTTQQASAALGVAGVGTVFFAAADRGGPADGLVAALVFDLVGIAIAGAGTLLLPRGAAAPVVATVGSVGTVGTVEAAGALAATTIGASGSRDWAVDVPTQLSAGTDLPARL